MKEQLRKRISSGSPSLPRHSFPIPIRSVWTVYQTIAWSWRCTYSGFPGRQIGRNPRRASAADRPDSALIPQPPYFLLGILAFVNYLGAQHVKRVDTTREDLQPLRSVRESGAAGEAGSARFTAFYPGGEYAPAKELLELFKAKNNKISYEFIDPDKQPQVAQQYQVTQYGEFQNPMTRRSVSDTER